MNSMNVLSLNSGSSSIRFGMFRVGSSRLEKLFSDTIDHPDLVGTITRITQRFLESDSPPPEAIGHRIVHGGPTLRQHCVIDETVLGQLDAATAFAPLHMPRALAIIRFTSEHFTGVPQVACFDTTFHSALPDIARVLPLPQQLLTMGIQRYGFHGLSCESILHQLNRLFPGELPERLVIAHLGSGASVTAVKGGKSIDTSMGMTPTGGVVMGTRSGDLDPGVLLHLMRVEKFDAAMLEDLLDRRSGLLGISGVSSDMRRLHEVAGENAAARLAIQMFCYSVRKQVAAMIAVLDGIDLLVFTGGIGENDAAVRASICRHLSWAGISLDAARNASATNPISDLRSACPVRVLASQEDEQIARHTATLPRQRVEPVANAGSTKY